MTTAIRELKPQFSIPSIIAIVAAVGSLFVGAMGGLILALIAIVFGVIGLLVSFSPNVRGGVTSIFSMILAGVGLIVAVAKALSWAFR